jgi:hypothetical protein
MYTVQLPYFATFDQLPSWVNCNGRIDRCACLEICTSAVWRFAKFKPAPTASGRISTGLVNLTADWLLGLQSTRMPRQLAGDYRTAQANAMRPLGMAPGRFVRRPDLVLGEPPPFADYGLPRNPNRGAARQKMLGIPETWSHPLRVELWRCGRVIKKHFLICPHPKNCGSQRSRGIELRDRSVSARRGSSRGDDELDDDGRIDLSDPRLPRLSTIQRGSKMNMKVCPQRVWKLFMVMCTPQELGDAKAARLWIESLPANVARRHQEFIVKLIDRYGLLFDPRRLLCQRCLGVRYNQGPERRRKQYAHGRGIEFRAAAQSPQTWECVRYGLSGAYVPATRQQR